MFGRNKTNNKKDLIDQDDLQIEGENFSNLEDNVSDKAESRFEGENYEPKSVVTNENESSEEFGFEQFISTFAEGKQEEIILSDNSIKLIKEDIVLEKPKEKFKFSYIIIGIIFTLLIFLSVFVAYIASTYSLVLNYNVEEADYYFDSPIKVSITRKGEYCDTDYLKEGMDILYCEEDVNIFSDFKKFKVKTINGTNVFGYDYSTKENKTVLLEDIYYIIDSRELQESTNEVNSDIKSEIKKE